MPPIASPTPPAPPAPIPLRKPLVIPPIICKPLNAAKPARRGSSGFRTLARLIRVSANFNVPLVRNENVSDLVTSLINSRNFSLVLVNCTSNAC